VNCGSPSGDSNGMQTRKSENLSVLWWLAPANSNYLMLLQRIIHYSRLQDWLLKESEFAIHTTGLSDLLILSLFKSNLSG